MIRLFPHLDEEDLILKLFHKAVANQWSSDALDWDAPLGLTERQALALTNIITPVYLGEQSAMNGAANVLPSLIAHGETSAQLYLSTFLLDEARHFEALTRLYRHMGQAPLALRKMPAMLRYHHRLSQGDRVDWLWGILISDLFAREFYLTFSKVQPNALFGRMSLQILRDESRHQAFAHAYLKAAIPTLSDSRRTALIDMKDQLLEIMESMNGDLREDSEVLGIDGDAFMQDLTRNIEAHGNAIGLGPKAGDDGHGPDATGRGPGTDWMRRLAAMREVSIRNGGVNWPEGRADAPGTVAGALPTIASEDVEFLFGGGGRRRPRERRAFPAAHPLAWLASCSSCAVALLCRTRVVRAAAGARA